MKQPIGTLAFCLCVAIGSQARCATLPDACGNDAVQFNVTTQKGQPAPAPPAGDKAQIVFIETAYGLNVTSRIGMDGAWVGADQGNSYLTLDVTPGLHHLCANWQSSFQTMDRLVQLYALNAEPGKVYYFLINAVATNFESYFTLAPLNVDEAMYLIQTSPLAASTQRK